MKRENMGDDELNGDGSGVDLLARYSVIQDLGPSVERATAKTSMLAFVFSTTRLAIPYRDLTQLEYDESRLPRGFLHLTFREHKITLRGQNLIPLFDALTQFEVASIRTVDRFADGVEERTTAVFDVEWREEVARHPVPQASQGSTSK